jgi:hypothetical protein
MTEKQAIYIGKSFLGPVVIATALWAKEGVPPTTLLLVALGCEAVWQSLNAWSAYLSDPNSKPKDIVAPPVSPIIEPKP